ncbi:hypothetical protein HNR65_002896 [Desulfosalsimonas propionicica]|uniref:Uncharacterized protein n=1 Tax=Desulfosalsimonas propionicica TaxID=332175 RepID=A0A7W0HLP2_9BACT|nr:hypothetical protein [Desulfosalsimonas propionicica]MBA2882544.1 hypothetical protein [Desulfosalsimonas propionicica]
MKNLFIYFTAGCIGAVANSLVVWFFGDIGITKAAGVAIAPALSAQWLYARIVWGGIWGLVFVLPLFRSNLVLKGSLLSLLPTIVQLLVIFPDAGKGMGGMALGTLTPVFVLFFNWIWGVVAAAAIKIAR